MSFIFTIGKQLRSCNDYIMNPDDVINIIPTEECLLDFKIQLKRNKQILKRNCIKYINGKYCKSSIQMIIDSFTDKNKSVVLNKLQIKYDEDKTIIKSVISMTVSEISMLSKKELKLFRYVPIYIEYYSIFPPIDPYYVGYWLGDGHSENPGSITIGDEDQPIIVPYLEKLCELYNLKINKYIGAKKLGFALSKGQDGLGRNINQSCFNNEWIDKIIQACKELEKSKKNDTAYTAFRKLYDPFKDNLRDNNYYCIKCDYNTKKVTKHTNDSSLQKSKQYSFREHLRSCHCITKESAKESWNKLTPTEKNKYKKQNNKRDICKKYGIDWVTLWKYNKLYETDGKDSIYKYVEEQKNKCSIIRYWFYKMNLINNKHIPEIYKKSTLDVRKSIIAGLIDSDGTSGGTFKNNTSFGITQKNESLILDIKEVAESLGWFCYLTKKYGCAVTTLADGTKKRSDKTLYHRLNMTPYENFDIPIKSIRKQIDSMTLKSCITNNNIRRERKLPYPTIFDIKSQSPN